jgi:hypothetical protein
VQRKRNALKAFNVGMDDKVRVGLVDYCHIEGVGLIGLCHI